MSTNASPQIIKSSLIYFAMIALQGGLQLILLPLQTHYLTPSEYGLLTTIIACTVVLSPIINLGLHGAAQRFILDYKKDSIEQAQLKSTLLILSLVAGLAMSTLLFLIAYLLPQEKLEYFLSLNQIILVLVHTIAMGIILVISEILRMLHQIKRYAMVIGTLSSSYLLMSILFIGVFHWGINGALSAFVVMPWIGCLTYLLIDPQTRNGFFKKDLISELLTYAIKLIPHFSFSTLNTVADRLLLAFILGKTMTGIYTAGTTIASAMLMVTSALIFSLRPFIYSCFRSNTPKALQEIRQLSLSAASLIALVGANIIVWSPEILNIFTSSAYHSAWQITLILTLKYMLQGLSAILLTSVLYNKDKVHHSIGIAGSSCMTLLVFSIALASPYGIWGVAIAGLIAASIELSLSYFTANNSTPRQWPILKMLTLIAIFLIPALLLLEITQSSHHSFLSIILIKSLFSIFSLSITASRSQLLTAFHFPPNNHPKASRQAHEVHAGGK